MSDIAEYPTTDWEEYASDSTNSLTIFRIRVPGGWLVNVNDDSETTSTSDTLFIADPGWSWIAQE